MRRADTPPGSALAGAWAVFRKEWTDALRDRRTLLMVLVSAVLMGPLVLVLLSGLVSDMEARAQSRQALVQGLGRAPTLENYLLRQGWQLREAPPEHERLLRENRLPQAVLRVEPDFEQALRERRAPRVTVVAASDNPRAQGSAQQLQALLQGFAHERARLELALRGVSPQVLQPLRVAEEDLAHPAARAARVTGMLPFFVLMAVLYGALNAALDTTAGERERGTLEPLLLNPVPPWALALGKWAAVAAVGLLIAVLSSLSFLPGQWLLQSESLAALFRYGPAEALRFIVLLLPLAAAMAAVLMAVALPCRTVKEAQASSTLVVLAVQMLPMVTLFSLEGESPWQRWVPGLAQFNLLNQVLKGSPVDAGALLASWLSCGLLSLLALASVARRLRRGAGG
ncbi:ABC transporter permease [Ideonella livida]|uniref:ABC transporter permease n=1 Tax=Ideonella livida TaxID=2707176 RepID=A0A7C9PIM8_9BURK|nr:ABC transporter permease subunit [Ideonella livida]NDY92953.1 ABC transporter permease [Ideonella livida]